MPHLVERLTLKNGNENSSGVKSVKQTDQARAGIFSRKTVSRAKKHSSQHRQNCAGAKRKQSKLSADDVIPWSASDVTQWPSNDVIQPVTSPSGQPITSFDGQWSVDDVSHNRASPLVRRIQGATESERRVPQSTSATTAETGESAYLLRHHL